MLSFKIQNWFIFQLLVLTLVSAIHLKVQEIHTDTQKAHDLKIVDELISQGKDALQTIGQKIDEAKVQVLDAGSSALNFIQEKENEAIQDIQNTIDPDRKVLSTTNSIIDSQKNLSEASISASSVDLIMAKVIQVPTISQRQCQQLQKQCLQSVGNQNQTDLTSKCDSINNYCLYKSNQHK